MRGLLLSLASALAVLSASACLRANGGTPAAQPAPPAALSIHHARIAAYQTCLSAIVRANDLAGEKNYQRLEVVLGRINVTCSSERAAAREALAAVVAANHPERQFQPTDAEKEELIRDATIRWASNATARSVLGEDR